MEDYRAELLRQVRAGDIATGEAASACLPGLLRRLDRHERGVARNIPVLSLYHRWRRHRLRLQVADARWHIEQGRAARMGELLGRR
ncbi:hypothetical protein M446_3029 [Methylobacterium sp. 4-46]|uniref:hypothetical protein n=1 Tax=unclassified Methylobacterium TaxID=2615210 RepID=UPI000152D59C|nr:MULTISPECIES: hypothetical protein [Methylobacterium]ACA17440.1 hypothetical protein M446_3029 [Methylobacterium sp. 4-46]WFT83125.1 hypothetical protein QA634_15370 [Methylobacterium nodulans]